MQRVAASSLQFWLAAHSALLYVRYDLKNPRLCVSMWSISFLVTPSLDIYVHLCMYSRRYHEPAAVSPNVEQREMWWCELSFDMPES